jgi:hypothetical protein
MTGDRTGSLTGKRALLLVVAGLLCAVAALAIGILLFGDFGSTEGRILATTAMLAGYSLLALPAAILYDQRRLRALAAIVAGLAVVGCTIATTIVWTHGDSETLGKTTGTAMSWLVASAGVGALAARRRVQDPQIVGRLFVLSAALAAFLATLITTVIWAELDDERVARVTGALVVLELLTVALQPLLARARPATQAVHLRVVVAPAETVDLTIEAADLAGAAAKAIRTLERDGRRVKLLEVADSGSNEATRGG